MRQHEENGSNLPTVFSYDETNKLRSIIIEDQPWFASIDICGILGIKNARHVIHSRLEEDERRRLKLPRQGETWFVNESGLYNLILRSDKPQARKFRKWVINEVLPTLRKTGTYSVSKAYPEIMGLPGVDVNGEPYYDYIELLCRLGCSTRSGSQGGRRRRNPQEFCHYNGYWRVNGRFAEYIIQMAKIRREQIELRKRKEHYLKVEKSRQLLLFRHY